MFISKYTVFVFFISSFRSIKPTLKNLKNDIELSCIFNWEESKYYVLIEWVGRLGGKIFCLRSGQMDWVPWVHTSWPRVKFPSSPTSLSQEAFLIIWPLKCWKFCLNQNMMRLHNIRWLRVGQQQKSFHNKSLSFISSLQIPTRNGSCHWITRLIVSFPFFFKFTEYTIAIHVKINMSCENDLKMWIAMWSANSPWFALLTLLCSGNNTKGIGILSKEGVLIIYYLNELHGNELVFALFKERYRVVYSYEQVRYFCDFSCYFNFSQRFIS